MSIKIVAISILASVSLLIFFAYTYWIPELKENAVACYSLSDEDAISMTSSSLKRVAANSVSGTVFNTSKPESLTVSSVDRMIGHKGDGFSEVRVWYSDLKTKKNVTEAVVYEDCEIKLFGP